MQELGLDRVYEAINLALSEQNYRRMEALLWPALDQFPTNPQLLFFASHAFTVQGKVLPALLCAQKSQELEPNGANYTNIGALYRRLNMPGPAYAALHEAVGYDPQNKHGWNNLAAAFVNEGNPLPGIEAADKAIAIDPDFAKARWNRGLLRLEAGDFAGGFADYRNGLAAGERMMRVYGADPEPKYVEKLEDLDAYTKHHGVLPRIAVWGEQGLGDEIMFSTILPDLAKHAEIVYECHPRMEKIMRDSYGNIVAEFYPTRKEIDPPAWYKFTDPVQFKCPLGDCMRWFRKSRDDFEDAKGHCSPWLMPDPELVSRYRQSLIALAPGKKYVGFAWTGGIISTLRWYRSAQLTDLEPIFNHPEIQPVSLQYEDDIQSVQAYLEKSGKLIFRLPGATTHFDYHHVLALVCALDSVVTVCQSIAHVAGAAGVDTRVMVPDKPAWRYGLEGSDWFLYDSPTLYRREGLSWGPIVESIKRDLFEYLDLEDAT